MQDQPQTGEPELEFHRIQDLHLSHISNTARYASWWQTLGIIQFNIRKTTLILLFSLEENINDLLLTATPQETTSDILIFRRSSVTHQIFLPLDGTRIPVSVVVAVHRRYANWTKPPGGSRATHPRGGHFISSCYPAVIG